MSSTKWKDGLLSSSLPLEFEVAKLLVKLGFGVDADFSYGRYDSNILKDFSIDIHAEYYPAYSAIFDLLIECKYRTPNKKWLFLPDPNKDYFTNYGLSDPVRYVDDFAIRYFGKRYSVQTPTGEPLPITYKGTEINLTDGSVYDADIRHGIAQLRYGLPRLLTERIVENFALMEEGNPFIFCPILVTTAEIYVMNPATSLKKVLKASKIDQLAKPVPYVVLHADYGPDFEMHCRSREFQELNQLTKQIEGEEKWKSFEDRRARIKGRRRIAHDLPSHLLRNLVALERTYMNRYFTQFFVARFSELPLLISDLKRSVNQTARTLRKIPTVRRIS
ncbi:MAG TPA: hypothetical protein VJR02_24645 [Pyrinomonadaceae bacterium]|nr:hypothetical protein [Pyrinomonadaceae bacterium]